MAIAAATGENNDAEITNTLENCSSVDDWVDALKENPSVGALISYTTADAHALLGFACIPGRDTSVCSQASDQGLLDYALDNPRLDELG